MGKPDLRQEITCDMVLPSRDCIRCGRRWYSFRFDMAIQQYALCVACLTEMFCADGVAVISVRDLQRMASEPPDGEPS